jgi:elongation factor Ts
MAEITAASVKELRERTGAGMMDCKKALAETSGEMEAAVDWLRAKGLSAAAKKAGRTAAEGLVGVAVEGARGAVVEVNSETDFVAKNEQFQDFVRNVAKLALQTGDEVEALKGATYPTGGTVEEKTDNIATIGENRCAAPRYLKSANVVVSYVHNAAALNMADRRAGRARGFSPGQTLQALGKQLAMHIAAANPLALMPRPDAGLIERERAIAEEKAKESGKPANTLRRWSRAAGPSSASMLWSPSCSSWTTRRRSPTSSPQPPRKPGRRSRSRASSASSSVRALRRSRTTSPRRSRPPPA